MDELGKINNINSVGDLLDFKLSIKTIALIVFGWGCVFAVIVVFMLGGVSNTLDYVTNFLDSAKKMIIDKKPKQASATTIEKKNDNINKEDD